MGHENTNWGQSVTAVVIRENKVLLARHTYGGGKGKLIIPGGYVNIGETPQQALIREYMEETHIEIKPTNIIGIVTSVERALVNPNIAKATVNDEKKSFKFFTYHPSKFQFIFWFTLSYFPARINAW